MSSFCKCKSYSHFFSKIISVYAIFSNQNFNDTLTNDIVSFEQLDPGFSVYFCSTYTSELQWKNRTFISCKISKDLYDIATDKHFFNLYTLKYLDTIIPYHTSSKFEQIHFTTF